MAESKLKHDEEVAEHQKEQEPTNQDKRDAHLLKLEKLRNHYADLRETEKSLKKNELFAEEDFAFLKNPPKKTKEERELMTPEEYELWCVECELCEEWANEGKVKKTEAAAREKIKQAKATTIPIEKEIEGMTPAEHEAFEKLNE
ncbi:MAG: hypothetical protein HY764_01925 [Candidatus Portnoybacteria bacterium]|nr:hypothetical protein [Candidatus Portnoybacteria bacterium]